MPEIFYDKMDRIFKDLGVELEDTNDKEKIINSGNFITTFSPDNHPIKID